MVTENVDRNSNNFIITTIELNIYFVFIVTKHIMCWPEACTANGTTNPSQPCPGLVLSVHKFIFSLCHCPSLHLFPFYADNF
jgi:hypothetical protein